MKNLFIGGTGRSGTTVLAKTLSECPGFYSLPTELRFITDPSGLIDLKSALVDDWSFYRGDFACERFLILINKLSRRFTNNYPNSNLINLVGKDFLDTWKNNFINEFTYDYSSNNWAARANIFTKIITKILGNPAYLNFILPNAFYTSPQGESDFFNVTKHNLDLFFNRISSLQKAEVIIDHTPTNVIHAKFLENIFSDLKLINIYRDPRDVIASYNSKDWGNSKFEFNVKWVFDILSQWEKIKKQLKPNNYLEIKFEDFVVNYSSIMEQIFIFLDYDVNFNIPNFDLSKHNIGRWKVDLTPDQQNFISGNHKDYLINYNYNISL